MKAKNKYGSNTEASDLSDLDVAEELAEKTRGGGETRSGGSQTDFDDIFVGAGGAPGGHVK